MFLFFYVTFSPKYNTVKKETLGPKGDAAGIWIGTYGLNTGETNWYFIEVLQWHLNLAGILEQLNSTYSGMSGIQTLVIKTQ